MSIRSYLARHWDGSRDGRCAHAAGSRGGSMSLSFHLNSSNSSAGGGMKDLLWLCCPRRRTLLCFSRTGHNTCCLQRFTFHLDRSRGRHGALVKRTGAGGCGDGRGLVGRRCWRRKWMGRRLLDWSSCFHKRCSAALALTFTFSTAHLVEGTSWCCCGGDLDRTATCTTDQLGAGHGTTGGLGGAGSGGDLNVGGRHLNGPHHGHRVWYHGGVGRRRHTGNLEYVVNKYGGGSDELRGSGDRCLGSEVLTGHGHHIGHGGRRRCLRGGTRRYGIGRHKDGDLVGADGAGGRDLND